MYNYTIEQAIDAYNNIKSQAILAWDKIGNKNDNNGIQQN